MLPDGSLTTAIVLAAGEGTRMHSATPKVLHPLAGRPLVEHAVRAAAELSPEYLVVVIGHGRDAVDAHLRSVAAALGREVLAAVQVQQLGTGHAVCVALDVLPTGLSGTVLVSYGDVPLLDTGTLSGLIAEHHRAGHAVTVLSTVVEDPAGYGRVLRDPSGAVTGIVEHRDATPQQRAIHEINSGVLAFDAGALRDALGRLAPANSQGELYLTDALGLVRSSGLPVGAHPCADPWLVAGVNDRVQLAAVGAELNRRLLEHWMRAGVTVVDPTSVWLDADVQLAPDVVLHPGVQLQAGTVVGPGATIGPDSTLSGCAVGAGAIVVRTHAVGAVVDDAAQIGPFAYLRPGSRVGERAKVGTFVETKNAQLGPGAKVPHLSYVGDATIGEGSNIGAATIFVNYDGVVKHHTTVGAHARTGADNMFVAPVTIGDGAYTAAGSVITQDVPPGALAVARSRQRNVEGWVSRRHPETPAAQAAKRAQQADGDQTRQERTMSLSTMWTIPKKSLMLFSGRYHPELADEVAKHLDVAVTPQSAYSFANGEIFVRFEESVRGCDAFVVQAHTAPINDAIMEQLIMVDALKRASAKRITAVMPFWGYSRQDKKHRGREPISARLVADLLKVAGADRIMTVDLHTSQIQGFFDGPVDHLFALPLLADHIKHTYAGRELAVVSPDSGRVRLAERWAETLGGTPLAFIHKTRDPGKPNQAVANRVVGDIDGRLCVVIDDMIDTGGTVAGAVRALLEAGATDAVVAATHGVLSGPAIERLSSCGAREVILTNTLPIADKNRFAGMTVLSIAPLLARAIHEVFEGGSVTSLFDGNA